MYGKSYTVNKRDSDRYSVYGWQLVSAAAMIGVLTSVMLVKMISPQSHNCDGIGFSRNAVICLRDGKYCLMFRVWDLQQKHILSTSFDVYVLGAVKTKEGERIENYATKLKIENEHVFLIWPITVVHIIDESSPFYEIPAKDLTHTKFEIAVCLKGASSLTALTSQSQTSYLPKEIFWGFRFKNALRFVPAIGSYVVDIEYLDMVEQVDTPMHSARRQLEVEYERRLAEERRRRELMTPQPLHASASFPLMSQSARSKWMPTLSPPLEGAASEACSDDATYA